MRPYVSIAIGLALAPVVTVITGPFWGNSNGVVYFPTKIETELGTIGVRSPIATFRSGPSAFLVSKCSNGRLNSTYGGLKYRWRMRPNLPEGVSRNLTPSVCR